MQGLLPAFALFGIMMLVKSHQLLVMLGTDSIWLCSIRLAGHICYMHACYVSCGLQHFSSREQVLMGVMDWLQLLKEEQYDKNMVVCCSAMVAGATNSFLDVVCCLVLLCVFLNRWRLRAG